VAASSVSDAGVPRLSVGIPASIARDFQPSDGITAIFIRGDINRWLVDLGRLVEHS
jgi:hypothetical protein